MGGVTVREYGLSFVGVCLKHYIGKSWPNRSRILWKW